MATLESTIRMLNRKLRQVFDFFGYKSPEYQTLQSILYQNFSDSGFIVRGGGVKPARLSRSKQAMLAYSKDEYLMEDIDLIYEAVKNQGSIRDMAERYVNYEDYSGELFTQKTANQLKDVIKERAYNAYISKFNDDDIYTEVQDEMNSNDAQHDSQYREDLADIYADFHKKPGKGNLAGMQQKYDEIQRKFDEAKTNKMERQLKQATDFSNEILKTGKDPYDMGLN